MMQLPDMDEETDVFFSHLRGLANGEESENLDLVSDFSLGIKFHDPSLYSFSDKDSLYNPVINHLVQLLLRVCFTSSRPYIDLLDKILDPLSFQEIRIYISDEIILESLKNPLTQVFAIGLLRKRVKSERTVFDFICKYDLIYHLVKDHLQCNGDGFLISEYINDVINDMLEIDPESIQPEKFRFLAEIVETPSPTSEELSKHFLSLSAITPVEFAEQAWASKMFSIDFDNLIDLDEKEKAVSNFYLASSTYVKWIEKVPFAWLKPFFGQFFDFILSKYPNQTASWNSNNEYILAFNNLLIDLINSKNEPLDFGLEILMHPNTKIIDHKEPKSFMFLMRLKLENIPHKDNFLKSIMNDCDISSGSSFAVGCTLALIQNETFFHLLVEKGLLTPGSFRDWQKAFIFELIATMSRFDFSAHYLISNLSDLVSTYLISVDRAISDTEIWRLKKDALRSLLLYRNVDLGCWRKGMSDCLYEMENGRRIGSIVPQVDVSTEAL